MAGFSSSFECHQRRMWADKSSSHAPRCCESREPVLKWMRYALCAIARTTHFEVMFMWPLENGHNMNGGAHADFFEKINFTILWNKTKNEKKKKKQSNETHIFMCTLLLCVYTPILSLFIGRSAFFILFTLLTRSWTAERVCVVCLCVFGWCSFMPLFHCIKCYYCLRSWMHLWSSSENNEQELYTRRRWRNDTKQALHAPFLPYLFAAHIAQCIQTL